MNDFVNKLKTMDYKGLALKHGEKIGLSLVIVFTLMVLYQTSWGSFEKSPQELVEQAKKAMNALTTLGWPDEEKQKFQVVDLEQRVKDQELAMKSDKFNFRQTFTPPLYPRMQPADRPTILPVEYPIVNTGNFPASTHPPASTVLASNDKPGEHANPDSAPISEEFDPELQGPAKATVPGLGAKIPDQATPNMDEDPLLRQKQRMRRDEPEGRAKGRPQPRDAETKNTVAKAPAVVIPGRGLRYVSYRAMFPYERQAQLMSDALHHNGIRRGAEDVEFYDFAIQRQRLIKKDPETWGTWETLDYETALSILDEVANYAPDVVRTEVTNPVITMPLPDRLRGQWHWLTVGHPVLKEYLLKKDVEIQKELEMNQAVLKTATELKLNQPKQRRRPGSGGSRGYTNYVNDLPNLYKNVNNAMMNDDRADNEIRRRMMPRNNAEAPGQFGTPRNGARQNPGLASITGSDPFAVPKWMLFRYLDFTVEPGECYRYRVQLEFINPNYQKALDKVVSADVAQGETLKSEWSEPSPPIFVEPDVDIFLAHVPRHQNALREGARLNVVEWDPRFGTNVTATMMKHFFGQVVGGPTKTDILDPFSRSLAERDIAIRTKQVFVDSKTIPPMTLNDNPDLGISKDQWERLELAGAFEHAVTANTAAELESHIPLAEIARQKKALSDTDKERKAFSEWRVREATTDTKTTGQDPLSRELAAGEKNLKKGNPKGVRSGPQNAASALNPLKPQSPRGRGGRGGQKGGGGGGGG